MRRRAVLAIAAALLLTGCADKPEPAAEAPKPLPPAGGHNDTDVMFAQMTLDFHRQGAEVVALAADKAARPEIRQLAAQMKQQWAAESATLTGWLQGWGAPLEANPDEGLHAGHGDLQSLKPAQLEELKNAPAGEFDTIALSLLLGHHHNSVEVARLEVKEGANAEVKAFAEQVTTTRQGQVQQMLKLMAG